MRVLVSGAGVAGPTLAYWLNRYGFETTIVEKAPQLRTGGYVIDFWGSGFEVAERMDLLNEVREQGYMVEEVRTVDAEGRRIAGFPAAAFTRVTKGRYVSLSRGDLAAAIFRRIENRVETIFGDTIRGLTEQSASVCVQFASGREREFDLVIGADGLHSRVRELAFGPEQQFEKFLGYKVAAFTTPGYRPRDELVYVMYTEVGQQVARFSMRGDCTVFLFVFSESNPEIGDMEKQKELLHRRFGHGGWECPAILKALDRAGDLYFDRVSQIRMNEWSQGRVALLGDAAYCVSLLAGQGSALAMTGAYILAGELHRARGDHATAFARYHAQMAPLLKAKQKAATGFAGAIAPQTHLGLWFRNRVMNLLRIPWIADYTIGRDLADRITLPAY